MENELKACPFCGSKNVELRNGIAFNGAVHCCDCTADVVFDAVELFLDSSKDWREAITRKWNCRKEVTTNETN